MRRLRLLVAALALVLIAAGAGATSTGAPTNESRYLTMRDGVKIAIDLWLPAAPTGRIPTLIRATRYWRAVGFANPKQPDSNLHEAEAVTGAGYALVLVDVRGSGASFGTWPSPWSRAEIADLGQVVDWIVRQPWSNGRVGAYGASYEGNTAEMLASVGRRAVKAVVPISDDFDPYAQNAFPGGIFSDWFVHVWNAGNQALDRNDVCALGGATGAKCRQLRKVVTGVKPVDGDVGGRLLRAAVRQHRRNIDVYAAGRELVFRDDRFGPTTIDAWSPFAYLPRLARAGVAVQAWAGWMDAGTVDGVLGRFMCARSPQMVIIGPWSHALGFDADPFHPADAPLRPSEVEQFRSHVAFLDPYLKGTSRPTATRQIRYYTLGEGAWHTTSTWPPPGLTTQRWFFGANGSLDRERPTATNGADKYAVNFEATTGRRNRWHTQAGGDVVYPDRTREDEKLLRYTSAPLERDLEITGHPVVTLDITSTATDGAFIVYLEDVAPSGRVTYITEGELRALHRKVSKRKPPYRVFGPYHSFLRADAEPLAPGRSAELRFALLPTSVLLRKGHRLRVAIAGHDKDTFARIPARGTPVVTVARSSAHPSSIDLPVRRR